MHVNEVMVRVWIDSIVGWHGPEDGETPNSPVAMAFLRGAFLEKKYILTYAPLDQISNDPGLQHFLSFIEGVAVTMRKAGIKGIDDDE